MPESADLEIVASAAQQTLETMFFTSILGDRGAPPEEPAVGVWVSFHGSPPGMLGLRLTSGAARTMAGNFLGAEDEQALSQAQVAEVVGELANMICGAVLSQIESGSTFDIHPPEPLPEGTEAAAGAVARCFDLDNGALEVWLSFGRA
jgi:CheY-specific phosphatase CheX